MRLVDCRKCRYFSSSPAEQPSYVLGWCKKRGDVVKYYTGLCRHFKRCEEELKKLTDFMR